MVTFHRHRWVEVVGGLLWDAVNAEVVFNNSLHPPAADFLTAASGRVHALVGCISAFCGNIFLVHVFKLLI